MSKYKVGDKFIINIKEVLESKKGTLYRANYNTLVFDDYGLDGLQKYDALQERLELIEELKKAEYNKGLNDAFEFFKKIWNSSIPMITIFGTDKISYLLDNLTPQEALAKLKAYEDSKIEVGDVVKEGDGETEFVVIATSDETTSRQPILRPIGKTLIKGVVFASDKDLKKTGKHIDIKSIIESIGE